MTITHRVSQVRVFGHRNPFSTISNCLHFQTTTVAVAVSASRCRHVARRDVGVREGACLAALIPPLLSGLLLWAGPGWRDVCHQTAAASGLQVGHRQASNLAFSLPPRSLAYQALNTTGTYVLSQFPALTNVLSLSPFLSPYI